MTQKSVSIGRRIRALKKIKILILSTVLANVQFVLLEQLDAQAQQESLAARTSSSKQVLLAQGYSPGQPIKLHDYGGRSSTSTLPSLSQPAAAPSLFSNSGSGNGGNNDRLPDLIPPMNVTEPASNSFPANDSSNSAVSVPQELAPTTSGGGSDTNATANPSANIEPAAKSKDKRPPKVHSQSGLSSKLKHFAGGVMNAAPDVLTGASEGYASGGSMQYQQGRPPMSNVPGVSGGSHLPGGGGFSPGKPGAGGIALGGEIGMELNSALQAEQAGNYEVAAKDFWYTCDLAVGGLGFKERNAFWETGNIGPYKCKDLYRRALKCHVTMYRGFLDQGKTWGINCSNDTFAVDLFKDLSCMELCDSQDASWYYLHALNDIAVDKQELAHARAFWQLGLCEHCPNCSPELKTKCEVLRDHIRLAGILELADENRAKFQNMEAQVWGQEHNTINIYTDSSGRVTHVIDSGAGMYRYYYPLMKEMLKNDYPKFKANYEKLLAYIHSLPNHAVAIPPGDGTPSIVEFKITQNEKISYGPVVYRTGGHF